jgi:HEAT repeat protein
MEFVAIASLLVGLASFIRDTGLQNSFKDQFFPEAPATQKFAKSVREATIKMFESCHLESEADEILNRFWVLIQDGKAEDIQTILNEHWFLNDSTPLELAQKILENPLLQNFGLDEGLPRKLIVVDVLTVLFDQFRRHLLLELSHTDLAHALQAMKNPQYSTKPMFAPYLNMVHIALNEHKFNGMPITTSEDPAKLSELFVPINGVLSQRKPSERRKNQPDSHQEQLDPFQPETTETGTPVDLREAVKSNAQTVILGSPGSGKSTVLRFLVSQHATTRPNENATEDRLPLFIPLRPYELKLDKNLLKFCCDYLNDEYKQKLPIELLEIMLERGECLVCFDGMDEVQNSANRDTIRDRIRSLVLQYPRNRWVITSRLVGYNAVALHSEEFRHYIAQPLQTPAIRLYVKRWHTLRSENESQRDSDIQNLTDRLFSPKSKAILILARNPLLLSMIVVLHHNNVMLPEKRTELYAKIVELLLETWNSRKGIEQLPDLSTNDQRYYLEVLAHKMQIESQGKESHYDKYFVCGVLQETIAKNVGCNPSKAETLTDALLQRVQKRAGLLIEDGSHMYRFAHQTFQEYLAACDIIENLNNSGETLMDYFKDKLLRPTWREVLQLSLGKFAENPRKRSSIQRFVNEIWQKGQQSDLEPITRAHLFLLGRLLVDGVVFDEMTTNLVLDGLETVALNEKELAQTAAILIGQIIALNANQYQRFVRIQESSNSEIPIIAAQALLEFEPSNADVLDRLKCIVKNNRNRQQFKAARILLKLEPGNTDVLDALKYIAKNDEHMWQVEAAQALLKLESGNTDALDVLKRIAQNDEHMWQIQAVLALLELKSDDADVLNIWTRIVKNNKDRREVATAQALLKLKPGNTDALNSLKRIAKDDKHTEQVEATQALIKLEPGNTDALDSLKRIAKDDKHVWQFEAAQVLLEIEPGNTDALDSLKRIAKDGVHYEQFQAVQALLEWHVNQ